MTNDPKQKLNLVKDPNEYFQELVQEALGQTKVHPQPETQYYLSRLLTQFMTTENLYARDENTGQLKNQTLAFRVKEALEEPHREVQKNIFQQIGDFSLYIGGFFPESLSKKLIDVDYYIDMGGVAYSQVAVRVEETREQSMFEELSQKFAQFVDVLSKISYNTTSQKSEKDLLHLYEKWLQTGSEQAAKQLEEAGITPTSMANSTRYKSQ